MIKIIKYSVGIICLILLFKTSALAASITNPSYYNSVTTIPQDLKDPCPVPCAFTDSGERLTPQCWNGSVPGQKIACGDACITGGGETQRSWTWYVFEQSQCRYDPTLSKQFAETVCTPIYIVSGESCSTADKYNLSSYPGGGDTTLERAGGCACETKGIYKTCCNGSTPVQTYVSDGNPNFPDVGCSFKTVACCPPGQTCDASYCNVFTSQGVECTTAPCGATACAPPATPTPTCKTITCGTNSGAGGTCTFGVTGNSNVPGCTATCPDGTRVAGFSVSVCQTNNCFFNDCTCYPNAGTCPNATPTPTPTQQRYNCSLASPSFCFSDPNGFFTTSNCDNRCNPTSTPTPTPTPTPASTPKYRCSGSSCIRDDNCTLGTGTCTTLSNCNNFCAPPPPNPCGAGWTLGSTRTTCTPNACTLK